MSLLLKSSPKTRRFDNRKLDSRKVAHRKRRHGAVLIEFAVVVALLLTILLGIMQFGIYLNATNALWNLSREGARFAAVQNSTNSASNTDIQNYIYKVMPPNLDRNDLTITISPNTPSARTSGTSVTVRLDYNMRKKLFLVPSSSADKGDKNKVYTSPLAGTYTTFSTMMVE